MCLSPRTTSDHAGCLLAGAAGVWVRVAVLGPWVSNAPRNTATRDRDRAAIRRTKPPCGICEGEIDYSLPHTDPMAYTVDHVIPLAKGGLDDLANKQAAHRVCNRMKSDKLAEDSAPRTFITARSW